MELCVAVVARPGAPGLAACLAALGAPARVETVGADGAGMARNRALAACTGDVLALVEDDVVVGARAGSTRCARRGRARPTTSR